ncbi:uncharacterized protein LOC120445206 isoform X1 [Drosophila santomea]|uniref:uncharacterized protein LOC120445206 isoform X1 n=1 Tax=Drosophila santomea TaxID=129105 RepID=UPI001954167B|nr:uncharacterized protein LOC120445206 isoform X1 [Drosophila santomea]
MPYYAFMMIGWFLIISIISILIRACCLCATQKTPRPATTSGRGPGGGPGPGETPSSRQPGRVLQSYRIDQSGVTLSTERNAFSAPEDPSANRYGDIFFIEPGSVEANRIRDQLEKDEKDLPSYDEVMRMCNLTTPTAAAAGPPVPPSPLGEPGPIGIAALPAPPYSETDPHAPSAGGVTVIAMETMEPSTSRAAQIPPSSGSGPPAPLPTTTV